MTPVLDRIPWLDPRSRAFGAVTPTLAVKPLRSYRWGIRTAPVLHQRGEGACVPFGWSAEIAARPVEIAGITDAFAFAMYEDVRAIDRREGRHFPDGATVLAGAKACRERGFIGAYRWAFGVEDVCRVLGYLGPVVLGINWHESMYEPRGDTLEVSGRVAGGHCILARGVDVKRRRVLLRNSWGADWGHHGDAWISMADLDRLLRARGEACIPERRARGKASVAS